MELDTNGILGQPQHMALGLGIPVVLVLGSERNYAQFTYPVIATTIDNSLYCYPHSNAFLTVSSFHMHFFALQQFKSGVSHQDAKSCNDVVSNSISQNKLSHLFDIIQSGIVKFVSALESVARTGLAPRKLVPVRGIGSSSQPG